MTNMCCRTAAEWRLTLDKYNYWLENVTGDEKKALIAMSEDERADSFYKDLEFGTGGLRGVMGLGTNRMNKYTVRRATQGLACEMLSHGADFAARGVVIAYDSRNNSAFFADEAARVLCANGIKTYIFDSLRPTPELSFAVRYLKAARGIVITGSHNPKKYNGYKVYGEDGGQIPPAAAGKVTEFIEATDVFKDVKTGDNTAEVVGKNVDDAYIAAVLEQKMNVEIPKDFKVVYTPIHGSGNIPVRRILKEIGAENVLVVAEQEKPDGNFPTVRVPNPENRDVFDMAIELASRENADIIIGTDPDSDRIGVVVKDKDGYFVLNGNQTGTLLAEFILKNTNPIPEKSKIVKTIVTTDMVESVAKAYGVGVDNVLTGFKFIGEKIKEYEKSGEHYIFGLEESYGYLKGTYARDKDAVVAAMLTVQMAADYKKQGKTLAEGLSDLYKKYGCYAQELVSVTCEGMDGSEKIRGIMRDLRENPPADKILDYSEGLDGLPKSNVLKYIMDDGWLVVRPSGTEPKIKIYFEMRGETIEEAKSRIETLKDKFMKRYIKSE